MIKCLLACSSSMPMRPSDRSSITPPTLKRTRCFCTWPSQLPTHHFKRHPSSSTWYFHPHLESISDTKVTSLTVSRDQGWETARVLGHDHWNGQSHRKRREYPEGEGTLRQQHHPVFFRCKFVLTQLNGLCGLSKSYSERRWVQPRVWREKLSIEGREELHLGGWHESHLLPPFPAY